VVEDEVVVPSPREDKVDENLLSLPVLGVDKLDVKLDSCSIIKLRLM